MSSITSKFHIHFEEKFFFSSQKMADIFGFVKCVWVESILMMMVIKHLPWPMYWISILFIHVEANRKQFIYVSNNQNLIYMCVSCTCISIEFRVHVCVSVSVHLHRLILSFWVLITFLVHTHGSISCSIFYYMMICVDVVMNDLCVMVNFFISLDAIWASFQQQFICSWNTYAHTQNYDNKKQIPNIADLSYFGPLIIDYSFFPTIVIWERQKNAHIHNHTIPYLDFKSRFNEKLFGVVRLKSNHSVISLVYISLFFCFSFFLLSYAQSLSTLTHSMNGMFCQWK